MEIMGSSREIMGSSRITESRQEICVPFGNYMKYGYYLLITGSILELHTECPQNKGSIRELWSVFGNDVQ